MHRPVFFEFGRSVPCDEQGWTPLNDFLQNAYLEREDRAVCTNYNLNLALLLGVCGFDMVLDIFYYSHMI